MQKKGQPCLTFSCILRIACCDYLCQSESVILAKDSAQKKKIKNTSEDEMRG